MNPALRAAALGAIVLAVTASGTATANAAAPKPRETVRVSLTTSGAEPDDFSGSPSISQDGRFIVYYTEASNIEPGRESVRGLVIRDVQEGTTELIGSTWDGSNTGGSISHAISADGRFVAFDSPQPFLPGELRTTYNVYVWDRITKAVTRITDGIGGAAPNGVSRDVSISADGRIVSFISYASNLVPNDTNWDPDVFVHDRETGVTTRASVNTAGKQANGASAWGTDISADGRWLIFESDAINLVAGDTNGKRDVFLHDLQSGRTIRVSTGPDGAQLDQPATGPSISATGRYITYNTTASNVVPGDTNGKNDVFLYDRIEKTTTRIGHAADGTEIGEGSYGGDLSANGRLIVFETSASDVVAGDTNDQTDLFVYDRVADTTARVSVATDGSQTTTWIGPGVISGSGQFVSYASEAVLTEGDTAGFSDVFRSPSRRKDS